MNIWRLQTKTANNDSAKIADYCIENNIIAIGWSLRFSQDKTAKEDYEEHGEKMLEREQISTFTEYKKFIDKHDFYGRKVNENVNRFCWHIKPNDLVWMRSSGVYYLGRVTEKSKWFFNTSQEAYDKDAANQYSDIEWHCIGDESNVPGAIATAFIRGMTLQRINKSGVAEFSRYIFNQKSGKKIYDDFSVSDPFDTFYNLLSTEDCEDLLCLWLYSKFGYVAIPSTNKKATELYECVLKDPKNGKCIYPQAKSYLDDNHKLLKDDYTHLKGDVWLFVARGEIYGDPDKKYNKIHVADPRELYNFVGSKKAANILPKSILNWYKMLSKLK